MQILCRILITAKKEYLSSSQRFDIIHHYDPIIIKSLYNKCHLLQDNAIFKTNNFLNKKNLNNFINIILFSNLNNAKNVIFGRYHFLK